MRIHWKIQLKNASHQWSCCWLQHDGNTNISKMQVTIVGAEGAQSWKTNLQLREILSDGTEDLIEMHDCTEKPWVQLFWIQNLKSSMSFCLNMLQIWIFVAKFSYMDPAVHNSSHSVVCSMLHSVEGQTQLPTTKYNIFLKPIFWTWSSPLFQGISDVGNYSESLSLTPTDSEC